MWKLMIATAALATSAMGAPPSVQCDMTHAFDQPDQEGKKSRAVWSDGRGEGLLFADTMNVNTDGTRRSYSVDDFWGESRAINNLCNAMSDKCAGLDESGMRQRRLLTQDAKAKGWPVDIVKRTRISPSIIPMPHGKPCAEVDGYLVSATALHRAHVTDACDLSNYVDAEQVSAIVLPSGAPGFATRKAAVGDLAVAMSADGRIIRYAVVGDSGPARELGEVSVALAGQLLGRTTPPANYREIRGRHPYEGRGWTVGRTFILVFPASRSASAPYMTMATIDDAAAKLFKSWGGAERLKACAANYR